MRRSVWVASLTLAVALAGVCRADEAFPARTVKLVVPAAGGSTTDTLARLIGDQLAQKWGKPVVVENIAGGAMNIGAERVFRSDPDGYTLMVAPPSPITINGMLYRDLPYDPGKFQPVALLAKVPNVLAVRKDMPAANVKELIAYAKANPGKLTYGSQGAGSTAHLSASQLEMLGGVKMVHVPYRGAVPALNDLIAGHIDMFFDTLTTSTPLFRDGKVKILAVAGAERASAMPDMPTIAESGLPGFRSVTWFALVAPQGTPDGVVGAINAAVNEALKSKLIGERLTTLMLEPMPGSPADAAKFFAEETALWGRVIKENNVTAQ